MGVSRDVGTKRCVLSHLRMVKMQHLSPSSGVLGKSHTWNPGVERGTQARHPEQPSGPSAVETALCVLSQGSLKFLNLWTRTIPDPDGFKKKFVNFILGPVLLIFNDYVRFFFLIYLIKTRLGCVSELSKR